MSLVLENAEEARNAITADQSKEIKALYDKWAKELAATAKQYEHKGTPSSALQAKQLKELEKAVKAASQQIANEINSGLKQSIEQAAQGVVSANAKWMESLGFPKSGVAAAFGNVPTTIVENLVTGKIYKSGWSLSKSIWGDNEDTLKKMYTIVAAGQAQNKSIYEISKDLERFVKPGAKKNWNLTFMQRDKTTGEMKKYRLYPKQVDYNAQRLARTLSQHGYQQGVLATSQNNPFITGIKWNAIGGRTCPLCAARNGVVYKKNDLPMDHPNGMCIMEPVVDPNMDDKLIAWVNNPDGTFPEIDAFAGQFGYSTKFSDLQEKYLAPYGFTPKNMPKDFDDWSHKLSYEQGKEILNAMGTSWGDPHPYQQLMKYYNQNLASVKGGFKQSVQQAVQAAQKEKKVKVAEFTWQQDKLLKKYGYTVDNMPEGYGEWLIKASGTDINALVSMANKKGMSHMEYYEKYIGTVKYKWKPASAVNATQTGQGGTVVFDKDAWIKKIKGQTESHMLDLENDAFNAFSDTGKSALRTYTGSSYEEMNGYLRYRAAGKSHSEAVRRSGISEYQLDAIKEAKNALSGWCTTEDLVLRRGTDLGDLAGFMPGNFSSNKRKLEGKSIEELNKMFSGTVGQYAGFTSTSSIWDKGFTGDVEMVFYAPKGTSGSSIMGISQYGTGEGETLLNAGTKVRILSVEESDGHKGSSIRVFVEILP